MKVLIMAGGTGGHVFPALAVAEALRARGDEVEWMGTETRMEGTLVPAAGFPLHAISVRGLRGNGLLGWALAPWRISVAVAQALNIMRRVRPAVVLGMGGFAAGPGGLAARMLRRPLVIHEQNAVTGMTNGLLARHAARVLEGFPGSFAARVGAVHTGNPVRADIAALPAPAQRYGARRGPLRLLVLGGSLGARALNEAVAGALAGLAAAERPLVWHQAGAANLADAQRAYAAHALTVGEQAAPTAGLTLAPFIDDMAAAYGWADLVLCRAGALTVAELAAAGVASALVPYPHAVDDHQTRNAAYLVAQGAGVLIPQDALDGERVAALLREYAGEAGRTRLLAMAEAARARALPDATARVVQHCLEVAHA
ncbi:undecaprenyldiphospho-muramoylpentapeptide beta-N-acetylglucosaminyltransferase [Ectothiorhodospiraceae bacterium 2226]|nr:undecaprenyldiphospho-muramoylpentapeptide beta-N-acetylglucosaminyltransferase [Ectothiorhodospiraceae bacterium 2226]